MKGAALYLRLLHYVLPYRRTFIISLCGTAVAAAMEPVIPALIKPLLDGSFVEKDPDFTRLMPLLLIGVFAIRGIAEFVGKVALEWVAQKVVMDIRSQLFAHILALPTTYFDDHPSGHVLSQLTYNVMQVMNAATQALITVLKDSLAVTGLLGWMLYLNWQLSLMAFVIAPAVALIMRLVSTRLRALSRDVQALMGDLNRVIDEALQSQKVIKLFGGQTYERSRFHHVNNRVRQFHVKLAIASEASGPLLQLLSSTALGIVIYFAALQSAQNQITVGGFVSLLGAMAMLMSPIKRLSKVNEHIQKGLAAAESIFALLDMSPEPDHGTHCSTQRAQGHIVFHDVHYRYRTGQEAAIAGLDLTIHPGETIGLVGLSGSGKSTLMHLLPRFYEIDRGHITLDGVPLSAWTLASLRAQIAYVGQDIVLFNDTVAANIAYGAGFASDRAEIVRAAEHAHAMAFIRALPQGLDTLIGENGTRLSGGQRQRIAIARALMKNAPILLLDEATSALDSAAEQSIQQALEQLRKGRTALIVAHRLSTIEYADRIVVLDRGHVVEMGTHQALLQQDGLYAQLYRLQHHERR